MRTLITVGFAGLFLIAPSLADDNKVTGLWLTETSDGFIDVQLLSDGTLEGKVAAGVGGDSDRRDSKNPDETLRSRSLLGVRILWNFKPDNEEKTQWSGGKVYDPNNGKTYDCKLRLDDGTLRIRGYVGIPLFGRTTVWTRSPKAPM